MLKFVLVVAIVALMIYLFVRLLEGRGFPRFPGRPGTPSRPLGPDDDPDFLRGLNRKNKRHPDDPSA